VPDFELQSDYQNKLTRTVNLPPGKSEPVWDAKRLHIASDRIDRGLRSALLTALYRPSPKEGTTFPTDH
jgi:hypothetical protein